MSMKKSPYPQWIGFSVALWMGLSSTALAVDPKYKPYLNLVYENIDGKSICLDLYLDPNITWNRPLIIFIHGGGWSGRTKTDGLAYADAFLKRGYVFATIDYRLS